MYLSLVFRTLLQSLITPSQILRTCRLIILLTAANNWDSSLLRTFLWVPRGRPTEFQLYNCCGGPLYDKASFQTPAPPRQVLEGSHPVTGVPRSGWPLYVQYTLSHIGVSDNEFADKRQLQKTGTTIPASASVLLWCGRLFFVSSGAYVILMSEVLLETVTHPSRALRCDRAMHLSGTGRLLAPIGPESDESCSNGGITETMLLC